MAVNKEIRDKLPDGCIIFNNEAYDNSILGVSLNGAAIYSFSKMVEEYMTDTECTYEEAEQWVEYNTVRSLPYMPDPQPIIMYELENVDD